MNQNGPRILLVSDQPHEAMALWQSLTESSQARVQVDVVTSLERAAAQMKASPVHAVVLDLNLPDSRGLGTLHCVRAAAGATPVIVIAQGATAQLREAALEAGAEEVYDTQDVNSGLVSHSVLYVMERQRARLQHARWQMLLATVPEAVVIADASGHVRFANPAAQALFGDPEATAAADLIDFRAPLEEPVDLLVCQGLHTLHCEVQLAAVEWDGLEARLASIRLLGAHAEAESSAARHRYGPACDLRTARAARPRDPALLPRQAAL